MGTEGIQGVVADMVQGWFMSHSLTLWLMSHPLWGAAGILLGIFLMWGLLRAIAQFIERLWLLVLRSPFNLGRWLFKNILRRFNNSIVEPQPPELPAPQLDEIVRRLERLQIEQQQLLLDVKTLLAQQQMSALDQRSSPSVRSQPPQPEKF